MRSLLLLAFLLSAQCAVAQTAAPGPRAGMAFVPMNPAIEADHSAMDKMMAGMEKPYTGDADQDFVSHMLPHHQGAIDMAQAELKYGTDPKMRQLAARIVAAQHDEISFMQAWQKKHPVPRAPRPANPHIQYK